MKKKGNCCKDQAVQKARQAPSEPSDQVTGSSGGRHELTVKLQLLLITAPQSSFSEAPQGEICGRDKLAYVSFSL